MKKKAVALSQEIVEKVAPHKNKCQTTSTLLCPMRWNLQSINNI
jgi:hypothetical protein